MSGDSASHSGRTTPKNVVVVGMPRSGTSLVAGIFARRGYFVAEDPEAELRPGDHHNPLGYWEAETLTRMNVAVFAAAGYHEDTTWLGAPISEEAVDRIGRLARLPGHREYVAAYEERAPWVWKDPRLCYTLGYWWPMLPQRETRVLLTRRDPEAIYASFVRTHWREAGKAAKDDVLARVESHLRTACETVDRLGIPCMEVRYGDLAENPTFVAQRLSAFLGLDLAADDLGFASKFDHSTLRGRTATLVEHSYERLPPGLRRLAKRMAPRALFRSLFPERRLPQPGTAAPAARSTSRPGRPLL